MLYISPEGGRRVRYGWVLCGSDSCSVGADGSRADGADHIPDGYPGSDERRDVDTEERGQRGHHLNHHFLEEDVTNPLADILLASL